MVTYLPQPQAELNPSHSHGKLIQRVCCNDRLVCRRVTRGGELGAVADKAIEDRDRSPTIEMKKKEERKNGIISRREEKDRRMEVYLKHGIAGAR